MPDHSKALPSQDALFKSFQVPYETVLTEESYIHFCIVMPPLLHDGNFLKGIIFTNRVCDALLERIPKIQEYFHVIASSFGPDYPTAALADAYLTLYPNPEREAWFRKNYPHCADKALIPMQGADYVNEYQFMPAPTPKEVELICVARIRPLKNLPMIARALKVYRKKYGFPCRMTLLGTGGKRRDFDCQDRNAWNPVEQKILGEMEDFLGNMDEYIDFVPWRCRNQGTLQKEYARAKLTVMGSLLEGKNKSIYESMSCNTPVVVFRQFNEGIRGDTPIFPEGAGLYAPEYDPESLADTIHQALHNLNSFTPREGMLNHYGRKRFVQMCMDALPYYRQTLPGYDDGSVFENPWLNLAMYSNWGTHVEGFVYKEQKQYTYQLAGLQELMAFAKGNMAAHLKSYFF
jgi:glycosyltransferase involved in cell wall biosynthesis